MESPNATVYEDAYSFHPDMEPVTRTNLRKLANNPPPNIQVRPSPPQASNVLNYDHVSREEIELRLHQAKLQGEKERNEMNKSCEDARKPPIYYKPPSRGSGSKYQGLESFLPPTVSHSPSNKVPLLGIRKTEDTDKSTDTKNTDTINTDTKNTDTNNLRSSYTKKILEAPQQEERPEASPTGLWVDPLMQMALSRQRNIGPYARRCLYCVVAFFWFRMVQSAMKMVFPNSTVVEWVQSVVYGAIVVVFGLSLQRVLTARDQCEDLPLSNRQRELLGLRRIEWGDEKTALEMAQRRFGRGLEEMPKYK